MNQTIYFRKGIWEKLKDEKNKSDLINGLLALHYGSQMGDKLDKTIRKAFNSSPVPRVLTEKKLVDVVSQIEKVVEWSPCKHGSDPSFCKYAKFVNGKKVCK